VQSVLQCRSSVNWVLIITSNVRPRWREPRHDEKYHGYFDLKQLRLYENINIFLYCTVILNKLCAIATPDHS
jgi:hypothetical protein